MENLFNNIYKGKKVLITGHTGFKGSWLSLWLTKLGADVVGYSIDIPSHPNHFELLKLNVTSITGDILDKKKVFETIEKYNPDIIFHMAAQALVRKSYVTPVETFETNIMGTVNILEACRLLKQPRVIVNVTSDKCYQNKEQTKGYTEEDSMGGNDPYSASKGCAELVAQAYRKSFFNPKEYGVSHSILLADVRAGNVIGGGDWADDRLIPDIMRATSEGKTTTIRNPDAIRPWQHVLEPLSGYLQVGGKLLEGKKEFADNWNFGPSEASCLTVGEVLEETKKYWGDVAYEIKKDTNNFHETNILKLDSSKAEKELGWHSVWDNESTIKKTTEWYKSYYTEKNIVSEKDLEEYIADAKKVFIGWSKI